MKTEKNGLGKNEIAVEKTRLQDFEIPLYKPLLDGKELEYVSECIKTNWVSSQGTFVKEFEKKFSSYVGVKCASYCTSGTTGLHLALMACGVKRGDEVIVPDLTFVATGTSVVHAGAKPVFADIDEETLNINPESFRKKITRKTKAVIPVHLYGNPAPMKEIVEIAQEKGIKVIEDAAEAHGAKIESKMVGSFGDAGVFSFYGNKIITTGEGGIVVSNNEELMEKVNLLKNHGMNPKNKYWHEVVGYNYRMTNLQAALGLAQLEKIEEKIAMKRQLAKNYERLFSECKEVELPIEKKDTRNVHSLYWIKAKNKNAKELISEIEKEKIETRPFFHPLSSLPIFKSKQKPVNSNMVFKQGICLPSYPNITTKEQEKVVSAVLRAIMQK